MERCSGKIEDCLNCKRWDCNEDHPKTIISVEEILGERVKRPVDKRIIARTEAGLCIKCGKKRPVEGIKLCPECREKNRLTRRAWGQRQKEMREHGNK